MKKIFCLLMLLLFGLSTSHAHAQDVQDTEDSQTPKIKMRLSQVTISATKTERDPLTTPGEVSVLDQDYFQQRQAQSLDDVLRYEPNVTTGLGPRTMGEQPNIRGLSGARVLTLVDGVRINFQSGHRGRIFLDMDQLKQVEVIRGPGSALYGSQAIGGVVAMQTKDPSDYLAPDMQYGIRQKFGYQDVNKEWLSTTTLSGRLTKQIEFMTSGTFRDGQNIRLGGDPSPLPNSAQYTAANLSKLVWKPTPYDEVKFSVQANRQSARIPFSTTSTTMSPTSISDRVNRTVTYRLGYSRDDQANPYLNLQGFVYLTTMEISQGVIANDQRDEIRYDTLGYDVRNSMNFGNPSSHHHIVTFGSEFFRNNQEGRGTRRGRFGGPTGAIVYWPTAESDVFALYVQDEITIMNRLTVIPALRWDHWRNERQGEKTQSVGVLNPKIGGVYQVTDFLFLSANYAHGFRQPTFQNLFISGTHFPGSIFAPNPDLGPERSRNIDVGLRVNLPEFLSDDDQFIFKGAYFRNKLKDRITSQTICNDEVVSFIFGQPCPDGSPRASRSGNVSEALIQGWEAEFEWRVSDSLVLNGNYSQIHGTDETTNLPLPDILPKRGMLGVNYLYAPWGLTIGGRTQMVADQTRTPPGFGGGANTTPGYTIFDLYATLRPVGALLPGLPKSWLQGWQVNLGIDNVTNQNYRRPLSPLPAAAINPKIQVWYNVNLP